MWLRLDPPSRERGREGVPWVSGSPHFQPSPCLWPHASAVDTGPWRMDNGGGEVVGWLRSDPSRTLHDPFTEARGGVPWLILAHIIMYLGITPRSLKADRSRHCRFLDFPHSRLIRQTSAVMSPPPPTSTRGMRCPSVWLRSPESESWATLNFGCGNSTPMSSQSHLLFVPFLPLQFVLSQLLPRTLFYFKRPLILNTFLSRTLF